MEDEVTQIFLDTISIIVSRCTIERAGYCRILEVKSLQLLDCIETIRVLFPPNHLQHFWIPIVNQHHFFPRVNAPEKSKPQEQLFIVM